MTRTMSEWHSIDYYWVQSMCALGAGELCGLSELHDIREHARIFETSDMS